MITTQQQKKLLRLNEQSLRKQSRSFSIPILKLDDSLRIPVMVQYNLNKTIDTIEDNPQLTIAEKIGFIHQFCDALKQHRHCPELAEQLIPLTPKDEAYVLQNYQATIDLFNTLAPNQQALGLKWTIEMAQGMCSYLQKPIITQDDLNDYCYYVAGSVGIYLTQLLHLTGSHVNTATDKSLEQKATHFGLFLQKLNIIRDYSEDTTEKQRQFWPQDYFQQSLSPREILNKLCQETLTNDIPHALDYVNALPTDQYSYECFIRFILASGLEYLKRLIDNKAVFAKQKVKLPKLLITNLYNKMTKHSRESFQDYCQQLYASCKRQMSEQLLLL